MKLKVLVFAVITAICFIGVFAPQAKAEGPVITPFAQFCSWMGYDYTDKWANRNPVTKAEGKARTDLDMNVVPQLNFGVRGTANNVTVMVSAMSTPFGSFSKDASEQYFYQLFLVFMEYKVGDATITIGKAGTPYTCLNFDDVGPGTSTSVGGWDLMLEFDMFEAFPYQLRVDYKGFFVDLVRNAGDTHTQSPLAENSFTGAPTTNTTKVKIPKIVVGYTYGNPMTPIFANVSGFYQTFKNDTATSTKTVNSYAIAAFGQYHMNGLGVLAEFNYGSNVGNMGYVGPSSYDGKNAKSYAGHIGVSYQMGAMRPSAGFGYRNNMKTLDGTKDDKSMSYFVSLAYAVQPNFTLTPTVQVFDKMKDNAGVKEGKFINFGVFVSASI